MFVVVYYYNPQQYLWSFHLQAVFGSTVTILEQVVFVSTVTILEKYRNVFLVLEGF